MYPKLPEKPKRYLGQRYRPYNRPNFNHGPNFNHKPNYNPIPPSYDPMLHLKSSIRQDRANQAVQMLASVLPQSK